MIRGLTTLATALALGPLGGCMLRATKVLDLLDAQTDAEVAESCEVATGYLVDRTLWLNPRLAAARVLGRLRPATPEVIGALGGVLDDTTEEPELRAYAAWALGEQRSDASLARLQAGLQRPLDELTGRYVLEGLAKHYALMAGSDERLVSVVEAMVFFAANQPNRPPPIYDVLGARTRTLPVNVRVLERAVDDAARGASDPRRIAAMYQATYEALERLERARGEITAGAATYTVQVESAVRAAHRAFLLEDPHTQVLALWYLGRLADLDRVALATAESFVGAEASNPLRPTLSRSTALRLIAAWTMARLSAPAPGPRRALAADILPGEVERVVLGLLADVSRRGGDLDQLQKVLGVEQPR